MDAPVSATAPVTHFVRTLVSLDNPGSETNQSSFPGHNSIEHYDDDDDLLNLSDVSLGEKSRQANQGHDSEHNSAHGHRRGSVRDYDHDHDREHEPEPEHKPEPEPKPEHKPTHLHSTSPEIEELQRELRELKSRLTNISRPDSILPSAPRNDLLQQQQQQQQQLTASLPALSLVPDQDPIVPRTECQRCCELVLENERVAQRCRELLIESDRLDVKCTTFTVENDALREENQTLHRLKEELEQEIRSSAHQRKELIDGIRLIETSLLKALNRTQSDNHDALDSAAVIQIQDQDQDYVGVDAAAIQNTITSLSAAFHANYDRLQLETRSLQQDLTLSQSRNEQLAQRLDQLEGEHRTLRNEHDTLREEHRTLNESLVLVTQEKNRNAMELATSHERIEEHESIRLILDTEVQTQKKSYEELSLRHRAIRRSEIQMHHRFLGVARQLLEMYRLVSDKQAKIREMETRVDSVSVENLNWKHKVMEIMNFLWQRNDRDTQETVIRIISEDIVLGSQAPMLVQAQAPMLVQAQTPMPVQTQTLMPVHSQSQSQSQHLHQHHPPSHSQPNDWYHLSASSPSPSQMHASHDSWYTLSSTTSLQTIPVNAASVLVSKK